jgi:serine/threonine protein phosphatase 1
MTTFAIGDIHGEAALLDSLLDLIRPEAGPGDSLVLLGDYICRGPDSRGVVDRILALRSGGWDGPVITLMGNHEDMLLDYDPARSQRRYHRGPWPGRDALLRSYGVEWLEEKEIDGLAFLPDAHLDFFRGLKFWHEDEHALYVHAGFAPGKRPEEATRQELLWIRERFWSADYTWRKPVVFGHRPQRVPGSNVWRPLDRQEKIGIDTGCSQGGPLSAVRLPDRRFFSVDAEGVYGGAVIGNAG